MTTVSVTEFRQHLAAWLDRVRAGEEVAVSDRGTVVARVVPPLDPKREARRRLAALAGVVSVGDVVSPAIPASEWNAVGSEG